MKRDFRFFAAARSVSAVLLLMVLGVALAQTGSRLTYAISNASVRSSYSQAVWDPNCNPAVSDCWIDPASGRTLSQQDVPTASSEGWMWVDLLLQEGDVCVGRVLMLGFDRSSGQVVPFLGGAFVTQGGCFDYQQPPGTLASLPTVNTPQQRVLRGPRPFGNVTLDTVSIGRYAPGASSQYTYDVASGYLITGSSRTQGGNISSIGPGAMLQSGQGNTNLTMLQLQGVRPLPGAAAEPLPDAVLRAQGLQYSCVETITMQGTPGMSTPCAVEVTFGQRGRGWMQGVIARQSVDLTTGIPSTTQIETVVTSNGIGGLYLSPRFLASLQVGAALDSDTVTGVQTFVQDSANGLLFITMQYAGGTTQYAYDLASGWLRAQADISAQGFATRNIYVELQGVR